MAARFLGVRAIRLTLLALCVLAAAPSARAASAGTPPRPTCDAGARAQATRPADSPLYTTQTVPNDPFVPTELAPDQWLAKVFTDGLGCAPAHASYAAYDAWIGANGCSPSTLAQLATTVLTSRAFLREPYTDAQRLLVLWRVGRESEPDPVQYGAQLAALKTRSESWREVVRRFLAAPGFAVLVPGMCAGQLYGTDPNRSVIDIPTSHTGAFGDGTGAQLQAVLDRARPGDTVWLERSAVVRVGAQVTIPPGVTLATVGAPGPDQYAAMARLVRTATNGQPVVALSSGSTLAGVWVDGQRSRQGVGMDHDSIDVAVLGGIGTTVREDRIGNTSGWSNMVVYNQATPSTPPCQGVNIADNLITGYESKFHWHETAGVVDGRVDVGTVTGQVNNFKSGQTGVSSSFGFADGISNQCWDSHIVGNQIVDATDVSIVLFGAARPDQATGIPHQHSVVEDNTIVNAGNSGWSAMTVDQLYQIGAAKYADFDGTSIRDNLIWTSPNAFLLLGTGIGTKPWFGANTAYAYGRVEYLDNTSGDGTINTQMAIAVSRMAGAVVSGNSLRATLALADMCPNGTYIGVDESEGSQVQQPSTAVSFPSFPIPSEDEGCLNLHF